MMGLFGGKTASKPLRLKAEDGEDVPAIAALVQDAALQMGDIAYDAAGHTLTLRMNRFCHEQGGSAPLRAPSVLRFDGVTKVQLRGLDLRQRTQALALLDISWEAGDPPGGAFLLRFAGEGARDIRIEAECIDLLLLDLAAPRRARSAPKHGI